MQKFLFDNSQVRRESFGSRDSLLVSFGLIYSFEFHSNFIAACNLLE